VLVSLGGQVQAQSSAEELKAEAAALTIEGQALLKGGSYFNAAAKFAAAYALVPHPVLLYNQAICQRLAGNRYSARSYYQKYIAVQSEGQLADLSRKFIAELDTSIAEDPTPDSKSEPTARPPLTPPPQPRSSGATEPATSLAPAAPQETTTPQTDVGVSAPPRDGARRMTPVTWTLAGVSAASLVAGSIFAMKAYSSYSSCQESGTCETDGDVDTIDRDFLLGDLFFGVAVATGATAAVLYLISDRESAPLTVSASTSSATVTYELSF